MHASVEQLDHMTRVLALRVSRTARVYQQKIAELEERKRNVRERRQEVQQLDMDRESVVRYLNSPKVAADPTKLFDADTRRRWLAYDREKADYYLDMALEDLAEAESDLAQKKNAWLKAQARETHIRDLRSHAAGQLALDRELKDSLEIQETFNSGKRSYG